MFIYVFREYRKEKLISNGFKDGKCVRLAILSRICSLDDSLNTGTIFCWGGGGGEGGWGEKSSKNPFFFGGGGGVRMGLEGNI